MLFNNRTDAGRALALRLQAFAGKKDTLLLALPRGGVPVASEVAKRLKLPMDVFIVRKIGAPDHEELALGAIASGGIRVMNDTIIYQLKVSRSTFDAVAAREQRELERREKLYRPTGALHAIESKNIILIDDGLATGASMRAAVRAVRTQHPAHIYVAVPVGAQEIVKEFKRDVDEVFCLETPSPFRGVGQWYNDFSQTSDEEVRVLLKKNRLPLHSVPRAEQLRA